MLEEMGEFFNLRAREYEDHQKTAILGAEEFYPFASSLLPDGKILDLGCGSGLELEDYFKEHPRASVTGIDLSTELLKLFEEKFQGKSFQLILGSFFEIPFPENAFDAAISSEALHHFPKEQKERLYRKLLPALKEGGYFVLVDYFADTDETERYFFEELKRLKQREGVEGLFHYDTPLTEAHEKELLLSSGFSKVETLKRWAATSVLVAYR